jgi:hypothetical protein
MSNGRDKMEQNAYPDDIVQKKYHFADKAVQAIKSNKRVIFLLDNPRDVELLIYLHNRGSHNLQIIVSSPAAAWELEKRGISHKYLNQYFDIDEERKIGYENFATLDGLCEEIDHAFFTNIPAIAHYNFRISKNFFPFLKILYDGIAFRVDVLKEIINRDKPDIIITVKNGESFFLDTGDPLGYPYSRDDSIYSFILDLEGWPCQSVQVVRNSVDKNTCESVLRSTKNAFMNSILLSNISLYSFVRLIKILGVRKSLSLLPVFAGNRLKKGKALIFTSYSVEWQELIPSLSQKGFRILFVNESEKITSTDETPDPVVLERLELKKYCIRQGTDFSPVFIKKISLLLNRVASDFINYHGIAEKMIGKNNPVACIGNVDSYQGKFLVIVAKYHGIPKVTWQHGTTGYFISPIFIYEELINSDYYFVWGKGVEEMYRSKEMDPYMPGPSVSGKIIPTGSTTLETLFTNEHIPDRNRRNIPRVLYGTMSYYHNALNFGFDHRFDDIGIWQAQKEIITFLSHGPYDVTVKLHPGEKEDYHIREFIRNENVKTVTIVKTERKFSELALESDIIILDCPSTILLEALAAKKTVFALFEFLMISDEARGLLKKRAFISENRKELLDQIQKYLNNEPMDLIPDINNTEFLEWYGVPRSDEPVSKKVTGILDTIQ